MKPVTFTALIALILAIPFLMKRKPVPARLGVGKRHRSSETDFRYDIDDFLT
jgi:hypothetical protein